jgi:hypothetical protein
MEQLHLLGLMDTVETLALLGPTSGMQSLQSGTDLGPMTLIWQGHLALQLVIQLPFLLTGLWHWWEQIATTQTWEQQECTNGTQQLQSGTDCLTVLTQIWLD